MSMPLEVIAREVLSLPASERAQLLDQLIASLDAEQERDARWNELAARRDAQADADQSMVVPVPEALARLRAAAR